MPSTAVISRTPPPPYLLTNIAILLISYVSESQPKKSSYVPEQHSIQKFNQLVVSSCGFDVESTSHYVLRCPMHNDERRTLLSSIKNIVCRLLDVTETVLIKAFLFENCSIDVHTNIQILNASIEYILTTKSWWVSVSFLIMKSFLIFFPLYNEKNMPMLIGHKTVRGTGSFIASFFAYCYFIGRLDFISILTFYFTPMHSENI